MRAVEGFNDYELIDAEGGERLERWGDIILVRPDPQIIWSGDRADKRWRDPPDLPGAAAAWRGLLPLPWS